MRKDAIRNRARLIAAAGDLMRSETFEPSMEDVAERAGLTRGTLYKYFPHRQSMYEAVLEHELKVVEDHLSTATEARPLDFMRAVTELIVLYDRFLVALSDMEDYDFAKNQARMAKTISGALHAAKVAGALRDDLTTDDVLMACRMLASHAGLDGAADRREGFNRRLRLLLRGLSQDEIAVG